MAALVRLIDQDGRIAVAFHVGPAARPLPVTGGKFLAQLIGVEAGVHTVESIPGGLVASVSAGVSVNANVLQVGWTDKSNIEGTDPARREKIAVVTALLRLFIIVASGLAMLLAAEAASSDKSQASAQAGALLFREKGCTFCHGEGGAGTEKAPDLTGLYNRKEWTPEKIAHQILTGGQKMPAFADSVTDEEAAQLVAYLRARRKPALPAPSATAP